MQGKCHSSWTTIFIKFLILKGVDTKMLRKVRNYFFLEEAEPSVSDKTVLILMALSLALAMYALVTVGMN